MTSGRAHAAVRFSSLALAAVVLVWAASVEAMPAARALLFQTAYAGYQDYEEEEEDEDAGAEEYAEDEGEDEDTEEYADEGSEDEEEYADQDADSEAEYESGEDDGSGEAEYAEEDASYAGEDDAAEVDDFSGDEPPAEFDESVDDPDSGEFDDAMVDEVEMASDDDSEAYAEGDQSEYLDDYEDDSWAPEVVESEFDDAIPVDERTWSEDLVWEVVEVEEFDAEGNLEDADEESEEDSVGAGELMIVSAGRRDPSSRPGPKPTGSKPLGSKPWGSKPPGSKPAGMKQSYGGRPVSALSVPWQAEIFNPKVKTVAGAKPTWQRAHYCGGTLIARDWVLTAAHCINQAMVDRGFKVRLGMTDLAKDDGQTYRIERIVRHSQYNPDNNDPAKPPNMYANDIALIRIADDGAPRPRDPKRIREIPLNRMPLAPGVPVSVTGWGVTGTGAADAASAVILRVDLQLMDTKVCQARPKFGPQKIHGNVFCAADPVRSTCRGDSGGPVVLTNKAPVLVGVVSWGKKTCAGDGRPGVYTRVDRYLDWIDKAMKLPAGRNALP